MEALIVPSLLVLLAVFAWLFGHDSRPRLRSREDDLARAGFSFDAETIALLPDTALPGATPAARAGTYVVARRVA